MGTYIENTGDTDDADDTFVRQATSAASSCKSSLENGPKARACPPPRVTIGNMPLPRPAIDLLPEAKRQQIVDALLSGRTTRDVAKMVGISFQQVAQYKRKHLYPAMHTAVRAVRQFGVEVESVSGVCQAVELTKSLTKGSPFLERHQQLWDRIENALDYAEWLEEEGLPSLPGLLTKLTKTWSYLVA